MQVVQEGLWKGCLGGLGLVIVYLVISGLCYLLLSQTGLSPNVVLVISIASGPVVGSFGILLPLYFRARRQLRSTVSSNETTPGDTP